MHSRLCRNAMEVEQAQETGSKWLLITSKDAEALGTGNQVGRGRRHRDTCLLILSA